MLSNREAADGYQITYSHNTINFNGMTLRPGSPRTMNACSMLGIDTQVFQLKEQNDFSDGSNNPEIIKIRYQHYVNKTHQLLTEIFLKRKEIIKRARVLQQQSIDSLDRSKSVKQGTLDSQMQQRVKKKMDHVYNQAIFKIVTSSTSQKLLLNDDEHQVSQVCDSADVQELEGGLNRELSRFKKHKIQKIREAQIKLDEDKKRVELLEKLQERESRVVQAMIKKQQDLKEKYTQKKHQKIETQEAEVRSLPEELELQKNGSNRYDKIQRSKHENNTDDQKEKKKRQLATYRKEEFEKQIDQECQQNMLKIQQKLEQSEKLQREQIQSKIEKIKEQNLKEQQIVKQQRELKERLSQQHFNSLLQKMVLKEKEFQTIQQSMMSIEQEKKIEQKQKQRKIKLNQGDLFQDREYYCSVISSKLRQLNEKFLKIDEFNKLKKEELENKILLKQELRKLKEQDKQDIIERQKRQNEFKMQQMTQKYKQMDDKNSLKQYQNVLLQQTSMQISKQEIIERNRIYSQLSQMSDNLFNKKIRKRNMLDQVMIKQNKEDTEFEDHTRLLITMLQTNQLQEIKTGKKEK